MKVAIERIETIPCGRPEQIRSPTLHVFEEPPFDGLSNRKKEKPGSERVGV